MTTSIKGGIPVGGNLAFRDLVYRPGVDGPAEMMPMPYYGGGMGVEQLAGGLSFPIGSQESHVDEEELFKERYKEPGSWRQHIKDYQRQNPLQRQVPSAGIGNVGGLLAQAIPPMGNAGSLGGIMEMGSRFGPKPLNIDINAVDDRLESVGGSANIQLDRDQMLRLGGSFSPGFTDPMGIPNPQGYQLYGEYTTPSLGVNVNYRNTRGNPSAIGGFPGEVQAGFKGRF